MPLKKRLLTENESFTDYCCDISGYSTHGYELTITLNPMIWSKHDSYKADTLVEDHLWGWLLPGYDPYDVVSVVQVKEYTKAGMAHYHLAIYTDSELPPAFRNGVTKGIQRLYGRCSFKSIIDKSAYIEYQNKDLEKNKKERGYEHFQIFNNDKRVDF